MKRTISCILSFALVLSAFLSGCQKNSNSSSSSEPKVTESSSVETQSSIYSNVSNWAYLEESIDPSKKADVFFLSPTAYSLSDGEEYNMSLANETAKMKCKALISMQKGIYDDNCRFFAPYYSQIALNVYPMGEEIRNSHLEVAFEDVKEAFEYYMDKYNNGRPVIVAGFSQGADMSIRLIKECFNTKSRQNQLVACYAIGWNITQEEVDAYPQLNFAEGESDTGVVISFNCEADSVENSSMVPKGIKTLAINPLSWKTDYEPASKELNLGACFLDYKGQITEEIKNFTGARIDETRGTIIPIDVDPADPRYDTTFQLMGEGVLHEYDYQFFYRNLEKNVQTRLDAFFNK